MGYVIAALAVAGAASGYMASQESTANQNNANWANYLNQEHQSRLKVQQQNDQQVRNYQQQTLQNLYIGRAATQTKIASKASLNRAASARFSALQHSNAASYDLLLSSFGGRHIGGTSGTAKALKRQAFRNWSSTAEAMKWNTKQQHQQIANKYDATLKSMGSNEFLMNSYIGGQAPQEINGGWAAIAAGVSGGVAGASAGSGMVNA